MWRTIGTDNVTELPHARLFYNFGEMGGFSLCRSKFDEVDESLKVLEFQDKPLDVKVPTQMVSLCRNY